MKDLLLIAGFGYLAYHLLGQKQAGDVRQETGAATPASPVSGLPSPVSPRPGIAIGEPHPGTGGGGGDYVGPYQPPVVDVQPYYGPPTDPFNDAFWSGGGSGPTYREQYPYRPGVIEAGGGEEIGLDFDY